MTKRKNNKIISLSTLIIIVISIWLISVIVSWFFFKDWTKSASFGDTFGAINSLFSGLALSGIIYTIYLQKTELSLQRKELKYTRKELKRTAFAQEDSAKSMSMQIRLANFPFLEYDSEFNSDEKCITVSSNSDNVAFDISIFIFSFVSESDYSYSEFINNNVHERYKNIALDISLIDDNLWGIYDVGFYPNLSKNKKIIIPVKFPINDGLYSLFIQYRDILGNNYSNSIHFNEYADFETTEDKPFSGLRINPDYPIVTERINFNEKRSLNGNFPRHINEIIKSKNASISLNATKAAEFRSNDFKWKVK